MNFVEELRWRNMLNDVMPGTEELLLKEKIKVVDNCILNFDKHFWNPSVEIGL